MYAIKKILLKFNVAILTSIFLSFFSISSFADYIDSKNELGIYFSSKIYEERNPYTNSPFMAQEGWMIGINSNTENHDSSNFYSLFQTRLGYGEVEYTSAGTGSMSGIPDWHFEFIGAFGQGYEGQSSRITPYIGAGFRYLANLSGYRLSSTGHYGYDRVSEYVYIPIGINIETNPVNESFWTYRAEYDYFVYGQQTSKLSQIAGYSDVTNDQDEGYGMKFTGKYNYDNNSGVEVYMDYWDIADSKPDTSGLFMEPRNSTTEIGIRFFWSY